MNQKITREEFDNNFINISKDLGYKLKVARKNKGYTILEMTKLTGMSDSYLSNIENNKGSKVSLHIYLLLCFYLDINPAEFFQNIKNFPPFSEKNY